VTGSSILDLVARADGSFLAAGFLSSQTGLLVRFDVERADVTEVGGPETIVTSVATTSAGDVAAGATLEDSSSTAMIWRSNEAGAWDANEGPREALFDPFCIGPTGWLGVSNFGRAELGNARVDMWLSADGNAWRLGSSIADATMAGILATDDGFIAAGAIGSAFHDLHPAIWRSADGQTWDRVERKDVTGTMSDVVRWRDGFVAAGSNILEGSAAGLIWVSRDGVIWTDVKGIDLKGMRLADAAASRDQLAIVGEKLGESLVLLAGLPE
jgi:hypothetical protein